ncbi:MAG: D-alanyl-D-alanine carboxypeptidase family protein [Bacillota bacterium]|nr:D-alanyl-D-alanine carboxypeptidase family protein [Bacillota bacterium]MDW7683493.1 D-alanyl-D-alanine carboxypeptidase family protein [Bacillota bacterium]
MKKRLLPLLLVIMILLSGPVFGQEFDTKAGVAALLDADTGQFLYLKNADEQRPPASITKVMTLLLAFEALDAGEINWEDTVTVSERAWRMGGSKMWLPLGENVLVEDIIKGISIVSANDGCIAIAEYLAGSEEAFVQRMNERARELGLTKTVFKNSTGWPAEGHLMSARDIAVLSRHLITNHPRILEIESETEFTFNDIKQENRNPLLGRFPNADGLKTGWTPESGYSLAGTALQNGMRLISVVLNTESEDERLVASQELLNYGFRNFERITAVQSGDSIEEVPVKHGRERTVNVVAAGDVPVTVPTGQEGSIELVVADRQELVAPVEKGTPAGTLLIQLDGETLATAPLETAEDVGRANIFVRIFRGIADFFRGLLGR